MTLRIASVCLLGFLALPSNASADIYLGNGNTGFGDVIGNGSLEFTQSGSVISGTFTKGAGGFNDALVLYIDTVEAAGFTDTSTFNDVDDDLRKAISGFDGTNRSTVNFASGFGAEYAIALNQSFGGVWSLSGTGFHDYVDTVSLSPTGTPTSATYNFAFDLALLELTAGDSFNFVGTYLNSGNAFRSNEGFGAGLGGTNPGYSPVTFSNSLTFATAVPEPSSFALAGIAGFGLMVVRRRRRVVARSAA